MHVTRTSSIIAVLLAAAGRLDPPPHHSHDSMCWVKAAGSGTVWATRGSKKNVELHFTPRYIHQYLFSGLAFYGQSPKVVDIYSILRNNF